MCSNRFCWRSAPVRGPGATRVLCRDCSMWRHAVRPSGWCWQMRSLTPKPTTSTFGNACVKRKLSSRAPGRSLATQIREALLLGLAYNLYRLRHRFPQRGCQQSLSVAGKGLMGTDCRLESNVLGWRDFGELEGPHGERP